MPAQRRSNWPALLAAFEKLRSVAVGKRLVQSLNDSPAAASLNVEQARRLTASYPSESSSCCGIFVGAIERRRQAKNARRTWKKLAPHVDGGNPAGGRQIFFSKQTSCYACHRIGEEGGRIGPDLSTIGQSRNRRDLLEAVVFPSSSLVRGFESYAITTSAGKVYAGLIVRETAEVIQLRTAQQEEVRLRRDEIDEMLPSHQSIMPDGLEKTMTTSQLSDLLSFLSSLKAPTDSKTN